jgi:hypothetical protein
VCGHIHEAPGVIRVESCLCVNAGGLGAPYGADQIAFVRRVGGAWSALHENLETGAKVELARV